jgi:hypothetical protein
LALENRVLAFESRVVAFEKEFWHLKNEMKDYKKNIYINNGRKLLRPYQVESDIRCAFASLIADGL